MVVIDPSGNASYNGVLVSLEHRFSSNFSALVNYTWSHCISEGDFQGDIGSATFLNPFNLAMDRGDCNYDLRHIFNTSLVLTSPFKGHSPVGALLRNWRLAPLVHAQSGLPLNVTDGKDLSLAGSNRASLDRPNVVSPNVYTSSMGPSLQWLNPAAFGFNAPGNIR